MASLGNPTLVPNALRYLTRRCNSLSMFPFFHSLGIEFTICLLFMTESRGDGLTPRPIMRYRYSREFNAISVRTLSANSPCQHNTFLNSLKQLQNCLFKNKLWPLAGFSKDLQRYGTTEYFAIALFLKYVMNTEIYLLLRVP